MKYKVHSQQWEEVSFNSVVRKSLRESHLNPNLKDNSGSGTLGGLYRVGSPHIKVRSGDCSSLEWPSGDTPRPRSEKHQPRQQAVEPLLRGAEVAVGRYPTSRGKGEAPAKW